MFSPSNEEIAMSRRSSLVIALLSLLFLIAAGVPASGETVYYKWVDGNGVTHYTNVQADTPKQGNVEKFEPPVQQEEAPAPEQPQPLKKSFPPAGTTELEPLPQPRVAPTPAQSKRLELRNELNKAREAELTFQTKALKWLTPDEVSQYLSKEDLQRMPRYGYDSGAPRVRRVEAIYFMRNKIKELEGALGK